MGKKRKFNEGDVLEEMVSHFWAHGYSATKVDQLSELTGLTKTSLYNAFGNKEALFLNSINFYVEQSLDTMKPYLDKNRSLYFNLEKLLEQTFLYSDQEVMSRGCFLTNSIVELHANEENLHDQVTKLCERVRKINFDFFQSYVEKGVIIGDYSASDLTDFYMTFWQGLRVESRNANGVESIRKSIKIFLSFIRSIEIAR